MTIDSEPQSKVPPNLALTALLSSGITIVTSISYTILCTITLIYRFNCDAAAPETSDNAQFSWHTIYRIYIQVYDEVYQLYCHYTAIWSMTWIPKKEPVTRQEEVDDIFYSLDEECPNALPTEYLTQSQTVFVLTTLTLCFSLLTLIASIVLIIAVKNQELAKYTNMIVFAYIVCWVGSLTVDITFATHLGMDYATLTEMLRDGSGYDFGLDLVRHGVLVIMAVTLKGYVTLALNLMLICLLITYSCRYQDEFKKEQHSIHKVGAINAFDQPRRVDDNWVQPEPINPYTSTFARGQRNNAYMNDDDQTRSLPRSDNYLSSSQSFNRSDSWQHQPPNHGARPFSYMDDIRRSVPLKPPASPAPLPQEPQWRRDPWQQGPPLPAPDYSPHSPRRLKSALKPAGYM